ncbi:MAG TPA: hypothetical protein VLA66_12090, partial [Thermoanaerobaculia bacterium]|nr:hypothetical protein [Thermoanaerobaculia bacterium]
MRFRAAFLAPALLVLAVAIAPLLSGARTLILRDTLNTHLGLRAYLGEAIRAGEIPILDPLRSGGQPLAGNPNALPFYPDNLLLLAGSTLWQLNAHFALHWLAAFAAAFWLGRAWGLGREGAAGAAAAYALSGYLFSQLNLYNAVAGAALAPALWAALLETGDERTRGRGLLGVGLAWALGILGGDPLLAGLALAGGVVAAAGRCGRRLPWGRLALALALGTLVAAPQIVETARIWGESYRGFQGYGGAVDGVRDPRALVDLLVPLFFGRPDLNNVWGESLFGGFPPLYFSLAPGLVAGALALAAGRPRRRGAMVLAALAVTGAVVTFTGGTLLGALLGGLPGGFFRFPEKLFLWSALGFAVAAGAGVERVARGEGARALARSIGLLTLPMVAIWLGLGVGDRA